jgi:hypothetical protein
MEMYAEIKFYNTGLSLAVGIFIISMTPKNVPYSNIIQIIKTVKKVIEFIQKKLLTIAFFEKFGTLFVERERER